MTTLADHERALLNTFAGARAKWLVWNMALAAALKWLENDVLVERSRFAVTDAGRSAPTRPGQRL